MVKNHFINLNKIIISQLAEGTRLDTRVLEEEIMSNNGGIDISNIDLTNIGSDEKYLALVPHFYRCRESIKKEKILEVANKYPNIMGPCSMKVNSIEELSEHMSRGYQVSHFHYILGKKHNLKRSFPKKCCGLSSRNVMLSLIYQGYPNAAYAYSNKYDHGYVVLPFVFENKNINGTIIIDPTSDQLGPLIERNSVFIKLGSLWQYVTEWEYRGNLFPDRICSIDILRKTATDIEDLIMYHQDGKNYFEEAFLNPITIKKD